MKFAILLTALILAGCNVSSGHISRHDKLPGGFVDESALSLKYPLCLRTDPASLRLTNEWVEDGLRIVVWTRRDGSTRSGTWYMGKGYSQDVKIWISWPTPKNNVFLKVAAASVYANKLTEDEETPSTLWQLSDFTTCKKG